MSSGGKGARVISIFGFSGFSIRTPGSVSDVLDSAALLAASKTGFSVWAIPAVSKILTAAMMDGYGWNPLTTEFDAVNVLNRIRSEVFAHE